MKRAARLSTNSSSKAIDQGFRIFSNREAITSSFLFLRRGTSARLFKYISMHGFEYIKMTITKKKEYIKMTDRHKKIDLAEISFNFFLC